MKNSLQNNIYDIYVCVIKEWLLLRNYFLSKTSDCNFATLYCNLKFRGLGSMLKFIAILYYFC